MSNQQLLLIRANKSRLNGQWSADDYDVRLGDAKGQVVGRIFRVTTVLKKPRWSWSITEQKSPAYGYAATREKAMAAFRATWDREHAPIGLLKLVNMIYSVINAERKRRRREWWLWYYNEATFVDRLCCRPPMKGVRITIIFVVMCFGIIFVKMTLGGH